jgi:hypothetical protein
MPCRQKLPIHERKAHYEFIGLVSMLTDLASLAPNEIGLPPKAAAAVAPSKNVSALVHHSSPLTNSACVDSVAFG